MIEFTFTFQLDELVSEMSSIYSKAKICDYKNPNKCDLSLEPGIVLFLTCLIKIYISKK